MNYRGGIPIGLAISIELRNECVLLFSNFNEFEDPGKLRAFVSVRNLELVKWCIPNTSELEYNELIKRLMEWGRSATEPALIDLLDALANDYTEDVKGKDCIRFIEKLRKELAQSGNFEQARDYEQLVERNAPNDGRGVDKLAEQWIEEAGDNLDELALRITLAVFHGTTFELIRRAKNDLFELLQQLSPPPSTQTPTPAIPHVPMMRRLEKAGATETEGKPPDWRRVIELDKPELAGEAIVYAWQLNRETEWRQKLFEWLTKYAVGHAAAVRTRAAVAAGRLAIKDYRFVRDYLLNRWVSENDAEYRMAVGMALGVIVREEHLTAEVQNLLRRWSASDSLDERWAAIRAYIYVGPYCRPVSEAITRWREIAASESDTDYITFLDDGSPMIWEKPLYMSLMDAMTRFFFYVAQQPGEERRLLYTGILEGLKKWIDDNDREAGLGLFMFFMIGRMHISSDESEDADSPPLLLQLMDEHLIQTEYRKQLAGLFELLMRKGSTILEAKELLCGWLGWANGLPRNSQLYEARIQTLFKDMIDADSSGRMRGKLAACLHECGRNRTAQGLLTTL